MGAANTEMAGAYPLYDADLFAPEALRHPFEHYRRVRDLGPVVRLRGVDALAIGRFGDVQAALRTPDVLISGAGVGFNEVFNSPGPEPNVLGSDGARHRKLRTQLTRPLMPGALRQHRDMLKSMISEQVRRVADGRTFDAVASVAKHLPLAAISFLVGIPEEGRQNMLRWATAIFNMVGPDSPAFAEDLATFREFRGYLLSIDPAQLSENGWAKTLFDAAENGRLTIGEARAALSGLLGPSLDTTINAKSNLLLNLAANPDQWAKLRRDPSLVPGAVYEGVRHSAVVRWFSRMAVADYRAGDVAIPQGTRVMVMYGSANRDERHYPEPDRFLVDRNPTDQLGWGTGPHMCGGMHLARLEMEVLLEALIETVEVLEVDEPVLGANRGLYGLESLPMRMKPLARPAPLAA